MSTNVIIDATRAEAPEPAAEAQARRFGKRKALIAAVGAVVLLGGAGVGGYIFLGGEEKPKAAADGASPDSYTEVPPLIVNIRTADGQPRFLKLRFIIVANDPGNSEQIKQKLPFILDALQPFLRELRPEDLNGSAAVFRVKEEMMTRISATMGGDIVRDVLIQDLVQQ